MQVITLSLDKRSDHMNAYLHASKINKGNFTCGIIILYLSIIYILCSTAISVLARRIARLAERGVHIIIWGPVDM